MKVNKRIFDLIFSLFLSVIFFLPGFFIFLLVRFTSKGPAFYHSNRIGVGNNVFSMPKFRTMRTDTPPIATHLMTDPDKFLTPIGKFLRKSSLDEIPQLFSILKGDMSFVGPRPALFNQDDLIEERTTLGVEKLIPGLTGWAQINGRDEISIPEKVKLDKYYLDEQSFWLDLKIICLTFFKVIFNRNICH